MKKIDQYVKIKRASEFLGVSPGTLRNWERRGLLETYRNPLNGYRLYDLQELEDLLKRIRNTEQS